MAVGAAPDDILYELVVVSCWGFHDLAQRFREALGGKESPLVRFRRKAVESLAIAKDDKAFLAEAGLPQDAAAELSFAATKSGERQQDPIAGCAGQRTAIHAPRRTPFVSPVPPGSGSYEFRADLFVRNIIR